MIWIPNSDQDILPTKENANKGFWISKYEISNIQYITYLKANKITSDIFSSTNMPQGYLTQEKYYSYPVVYISWNHAYNFAKWLLKSVKKDNYIGTQTTIRLPTLKEINKVAGDNPNSFPWGTSNDSEIEAAKHANFFSKRDGYNFTAPVDQYKIGSSKYGVYNIAGNVSEWLWDSDNIRQEQKKILNSSWRSRLECLKTCDELVIREEKPDFQNDEIGFRLVIIEE